MTTDPFYDDLDLPGPPCELAWLPFAALWTASAIAGIAVAVIVNAIVNRRTPT